MRADAEQDGIATITQWELDAAFVQTRRPAEAACRAQFNRCEAKAFRLRGPS